MSNQKNCKMKRFVYAVMLLLGLSLVSPSCAPSPEKAGKRDAKAMCRAIEKDDSKARFKANNSFAKHRVYFQKKNQFDEFYDAYTKYMDKYAAE